MLGKYRLKIYALGLVIALSLVVALAYNAFRGNFSSTEPVTVVAERAGLLMTAGAKVTYRGVEVGRVTALQADGRTARISAQIDSDVIDQIPADARVEISSTTVFGAKYVNFVAPESTDGPGLQPHSVINTDDVQVEINTTFQNLTDVLRQIEPQKLNVTLAALDGALGQGRGADLGDTIDKATSLLRQINSPGTRLGTTLDAAADAIMAYAPSAPQLAAIASQVRTTASTITDKTDGIDLMLTSVMGLSGTATDFLKTNTPTLTESLRLFTPTTGLMREYSPQFTCLIKGMDKLLERGLPALGSAKYPGIHLNIGFVPGVPLYGYPANLPVVGASGGPHCYGLPVLAPGTVSPYVVTNTGVNPYRNEPGSLELHPEDLLTSLVGQPVKGGR